MIEVVPGDICPKSGVWIPSGSPNFYPAEYAEKVMHRNFNAGEVMPLTPHGEPSWILQERRGEPLIDFTGLSPEEIGVILEKGRVCNHSIRGDHLGSKQHWSKIWWSPIERQSKKLD